MGRTWILNAFCTSGVAGCTKLTKLTTKENWNNKEIIPTCFIVKYFNFLNKILFLNFILMEHSTNYIKWRLSAIRPPSAPHKVECYISSAKVNVQEKLHSYNLINFVFIYQKIIFNKTNTIITRSFQDFRFLGINNIY